MEPRRKAYPIVVGFAVLGIATVILALAALLLTTPIPTDCGPWTGTRALLLQLEQACALYHQSFGVYPPEDADGGVLSFMIALIAPRGPSKPGVLGAEWAGNSGRIEGKWGTPLRYQLEQTSKRPLFRSAGPDGRFDTTDDIVQSPTW